LVLAEIDDPTAARILAYFRTWEPSNAAAVLVHEPQGMATRSLVLRDAESGRFFHEVPPIRAAWERYTAAKDGPRGQCLITGRENEPIELTHPPIRGIPDPGSQRAEWRLVSFNLPAFTSYGKEQSRNAPVGVAAAFA
jgi:CRISPR-associated protein Csd1